MNHFRLVVDDKTFDIEILNNPQAEEVQVKVDGNLFNVKVEDLSVDTPVLPQPISVSAPVSAAPIAASPVAVAPAPIAAGANTVNAPLPGKINAIKVSKGQIVKANDPLVVIEAMKAMNIIRAQRDGKIGNIYVTVGGHVAYGAAIMDIE
ncbi:MAG: biotin/lipoyl-containing protein [Anaerolineaceae bacterium]